jgi:hypothetical protein
MIVIVILFLLCASSFLLYMNSWYIQTAIYTHGDIYKR